MLAFMWTILGLCKVCNTAQPVLRTKMASLLAKIGGSSNSLLKTVAIRSQYKAFIKYAQDPAPDGHRCGICPTYQQKMCAFDFKSNDTYIFDNHCIMDLYNCMHATNFAPMYYEECLFFGNFAYVYGIRHEDEDYDEDHIKIIGAKKNPGFV